MVYVKDLWRHSPQYETLQWASVWMAPENWPFTVEDVVKRLNEALGWLGSDFRFAPDPRLSNDHYAWMQMRDHNQAFAVAALGRIVAQTLLDERGQP